MWEGSRRSLIEGAAALAMLSSAATARACEARVTMPPTETLIRYDPFVSTRVPADISFTVSNPGQEACSIDVAIVDVDRQTLGSVSLSDAPVVVEIRPGQGAVLTPTAAPGVWSAQIAAGGEFVFHLSGSIVRDGVPSAGRHERRLNLELREVGAVSPIGSPVPLVLVLDTPPRSQMNIAGAAAAFGEGVTISSVDLGVLSQGLNRRVFLQVRSNVEFSRLSIRSEYRGFLMPQVDRPSSDAPGVPYVVNIAEVPIDLSAEYETRVKAPHTLAGESLPLDILVGDVAGRMSGSYRDVLTFELSPL